MRTRGSVDKTRVASEICCHLRAICGRAALVYRTAFRRTLAFKRRNEGAKNGLRRRRGQWSHGGYPDGVATREDKSIVYRGILTIRPKIQHRCGGKWGSENFGVLRQCQGPYTSRQTAETGSSFFLPRPRNWPQIIPDLTRCRRSRRFPSNLHSAIREAVLTVPRSR